MMSLGVQIKYSKPQQWPDLITITSQQHIRYLK
jgi:hypothetical protein